jgi:ABC-type antimicrobial peptide transport system permease subunit
MALGADRSDVLWLVLRGAFAQVGLGLLLGIPLVFAARRALEHQLYGIAGFDARSLAVAVITLAACAFAASLLPARRAAAIDPMRALRTE